MTDWTSLRQQIVPQRTKPLLPARIKLPVLPITVLRLLRESADPQADPAEIARIIETDSWLTCELLRHVNSASVGLSHQVSSPQQAIAILGVPACKTFLLCTVLKRAMKDIQSRMINMEAFWISNMERALLAREVADLLEADRNLAYAGGMLQDFLLPVLTNEYYSDYSDFLQLQRDVPTSLADWERARFGWNHAEAAAAVMQNWGFPDSLICCVFLHHHGPKLLKDPRFHRTAAAAAAVSALLPGPLVPDDRALQALHRLDASWAEFDLPAIAERIDDHIDRTSRLPRQPLAVKLQPLAAVQS